MADSSFRSGYVALAGRPNVGKSTLLNALVGEKLAITTRRPQTTRDRILGILTDAEAQVVFIDTPGMHMPRNRLGEYMVREAREGYGDADVVLFLVEPTPLREEDFRLLEMLAPLPVPTILVVTKIDTVNRDALLGWIDTFSRLGDFVEVVPVSAAQGLNMDRLLACVKKALPPGPLYFPDDVLTDRTERFIAAEIIREQIMVHTGDEIPYSVAVEIESFEELPEGGARIRAVIYVERDSQKGIIIGRAGSKLKGIGIGARRGIAQLIDGPVHLKLWVKVRKEWRDDPGSLRELGYGR